MLRDVSRRKEWDKTCTEVGIRMVFAGAHTQLIRMVFEKPASKTFSPFTWQASSEYQEMLIIRAWREDKCSNSFVVVSRSVRCDSMTLSPGMKQGEILPTGWIISEVPGSEGTAAQVVRIGQFSHESFEFVRPHALGLVQNFRNLMEKEATKNAGGSSVEELEEGDYI